MLAFILLFLFGRGMRFFWPDPPIESKDNAPERSGNESSAGKKNIGAIITSACLLAGVALLTLNVNFLPPLKIQGGINSFPLEFHGWKGRPESVSSEIVDASGAEEAFSGFYTRKRDEAVSLYIGYRSSAFLENENFFHSPTVCLPASGWKVINKSKRIINDVPFFQTLPVTEMIIENMGIKQIVYFWFQTKEKVTHDKNINRFHLALHAIKKDNTYDLFIRPITPVGENETLDQARKRMDLFSREMLDTLISFLKENQVTEN